MQKSKITMMCLVLLGAMGLAACGSDGNKGGLEGAAVPNDNGVVVEPGPGDGGAKEDPSQPVEPGREEGGAVVTDPGAGGDAGKPPEGSGDTGGTAGGDAGGGVVTDPGAGTNDGSAILDALKELGTGAQRTRIEYVLDVCKDPACTEQTGKIIDYLKSECPTSAGCTNPVALALLYGKEPSASNRQAGICPVGDCVRIEDLTNVVYKVFGIDPANDAGASGGSDGSTQPGTGASGGSDGSTQPGTGAAGGDRGGSAGGTQPGSGAAGGGSDGSGGAGSGAAPVKP